MTKITTTRNAVRQLLFMLLFLAPAAWASFDASVDRAQLALHETLELTLRADTNNSASPDLNALEKNFDILGTRRSQQMRIINGRSESWKDWIITLSPKTTGSLTIPAIPLGSERSNPVTINVQKTSSQTGNTASISPVFMKTQVNHETVYTQQELMLTIRIFHSVSLYEDSRLSSLDIDDAIVNQLGDTQRFETVIDGTRYGGFEVKYAIYPQKAGALTIPALSFTGTMADRRDPFGGVFSMGGKPVVARSSEISVTVLAPPANYKGHDWLPSQGLSLNETWSQPLDSIKVGDAVTRTITMEAKGLTAAQLPPVHIPSPTGANTYPDQSSASDTPTDDGIIGKRITAMALVPTEAGTIQLPAIHITWFDTVNNTPRTATIAEQTLQVKAGDIASPVLPAAQPAKVTPPSSTEMPVEDAMPALQQSISYFWQWLALGFALLWLVTMGSFWWFWRQSKQAISQNKSKGNAVADTSDQASYPQSANEQTAFGALQTACLSGDKPEMILENMKHWCRLFLDTPSLQTAQQCAAYLNYEQLKILCAELDAAIYSGESSETTGNEILSVCSVIRKTYKPETEEPLEDLYPS